MCVRRLTEFVVCVFRHVLLFHGSLYAHHGVVDAQSPAHRIVGWVASTESPCKGHGHRLVVVHDAALDGAGMSVDCDGAAGLAPPEVDLSWCAGSSRDARASVTAVPDVAMAGAAAASPMLDHMHFVGAQDTPDAPVTDEALQRAMVAAGNGSLLSEVESVALAKLLLDRPSDVGVPDDLVQLLYLAGCDGAGEFRGVPGSCVYEYVDSFVAESSGASPNAGSTFCRRPSSKRARVASATVATVAVGAATSEVEDSFDNGAVGGDCSVVDDGRVYEMQRDGFSVESVFDPDGAVFTEVSAVLQGLPVAARLHVFQALSAADSEWSGRSSGPYARQYESEVKGSGSRSESKGQNGDGKRAMVMISSAGLDAGGDGVDRGRLATHTLAADVHPKFIEFVGSMVRGTGEPVGVQLVSRTPALLVREAGCTTQALHIDDTDSDGEFLIAVLTDGYHFRVVPGSHRFLGVFSGTCHESDVVDLVLKRGDVLRCKVNTIHCGGCNPTSNPMFGLHVYRDCGERQRVHNSTYRISVDREPGRNPSLAHADVMREIDFNRLWVYLAAVFEYSGTLTYIAGTMLKPAASNTILEFPYGCVLACESGFQAPFNVADGVLVGGIHFLTSSAAEGSKGMPARVAVEFAARHVLGMMHEIVIMDGGVTSSSSSCFWDRLGFRAVLGCPGFKRVTRDDLLTHIDSLWANSSLRRVQVQHFRSMLPRVYRADLRMSIGEIGALEDSMDPSLEYRMESWTFAAVAPDTGAGAGSGDAGGGAAGRDGADAASGGVVANVSSCQANTCQLLLALLRRVKNVGEFPSGVVLNWPSVSRSRDSRECLVGVCERLTAEVMDQSKDPSVVAYTSRLLDEIATLAVTLTPMDGGPAVFAATNRQRVADLLADTMDSTVGDVPCLKLVEACAESRVADGVVLLTNECDSSVVRGARVHLYVANRVHLRSLKTPGLLGCNVTQLAREHAWAYVCLRQLWSVDASVVLQRTGTEHRVRQAFRFDVDNGFFSAVSVPVELSRARNCSHMVEKAMCAHWTECVSVRLERMRSAGGLFNVDELNRLRDKCRQAEAGPYGLFSAVVAMILNANNSDESATRVFSQWLVFLSDATGTETTSPFDVSANGSIPVVVAAASLQTWAVAYERRVGSKPFGAAINKIEFICRAASVPGRHWKWLHATLMGMRGPPSVLAVVPLSEGIYSSTLLERVVILCASLPEQFELGAASLGWDTKSLLVILLEVYRVVSVPMDALAYRAVLREFGPMVVRTAAVTSGTGLEVQIHHLPSQSLKSAVGSPDADLGHVVHAALGRMAVSQAAEVADTLRRAEQSVGVEVSISRPLDDYYMGEDYPTTPPSVKHFEGMSTKQIERSMVDYALAAGVKVGGVVFDPLHRPPSSMGSDPRGDGRLARYVVAQVRRMLEKQAAGPASPGIDGMWMWEKQVAWLASLGIDGRLPAPVHMPGTFTVGAVVGRSATLRDMSVEVVQMNLEMKLKGSVSCGVWFGRGASASLDGDADPVGDDDPDVAFVFTLAVAAARCTEPEGGGGTGWRHERRGGWVRTGTVPFPAYTGVSNFQSREHVVEEVRRRDVVMALYAAAMRSTTTYRIDLYAAGVASKKLQRHADEPLCRFEWCSSGQLCPLSPDKWCDPEPPSLLSRLAVSAVRWWSPDRWQFHARRFLLPVVVEFRCGICLEHVKFADASYVVRQHVSARLLRMSNTYLEHLTEVNALKPESHPDWVLVLASSALYTTPCGHQMCTSCAYRTASSGNNAFMVGEQSVYRWKCPHCRHSIDVSGIEEHFVATL